MVFIARNVSSKAPDNTYKIPKCSKMTKKSSKAGMKRCDLYVFESLVMTYFNFSLYFFMKEKNHLAQKTLFFSSYRGEDVC